MVERVDFAGAVSMITVRLPAGDAAATTLTLPAASIAPPRVGTVVAVAIHGTAHPVD